MSDLIRVLVIDKDAQDCKVIKGLLNGGRFFVDCYPSIEPFDQEYDLVLLVTGGLDKEGATKAVANVHQVVGDVPVVLVSEDLSLAHRKEVQETGAIALIPRSMLQSEERFLESLLVGVLWCEHKRREVKAEVLASIDEALNRMSAAE